MTARNDRAVTLGELAGTVTRIYDARYASKEDAQLTGTPTAPTAASGTSTTQIATTAFATTAATTAAGAATTPMTRAQILEVTSPDTGTQA